MEKEFADGWYVHEHTNYREVVVAPGSMCSMVTLVRKPDLYFKISKGAVETMIVDGERLKAVQNLQARESQREPNRAAFYISKTGGISTVDPNVFIVEADRNSVIIEQQSAEIKRFYEACVVASNGDILNM